MIPVRGGEIVATILVRDLLRQIPRHARVDVAAHHVIDGLAAIDKGPAAATGLS
jgi:hypothetical protein